eukprot:12398040-Heterocapsa_arctica.AAC.1
MMVLKKVLMNSPPGSYIITWHQKQHMNAGALHAIIIDGVWYPQRATTKSNKQNTVMANAFYVNATKRDYSTYGGNVKPVILIQISTGYS